MRQATHNGLREAGVEDIGARQVDLFESAPTEPEAFLRWGERLEPEDGKFELSRGRVTCRMAHAPRAHSRAAGDIILELGRLLAPNRIDIGIADELTTSTPILIAGVLSPPIAGVDFTEKREEDTAVDTLEPDLTTSQGEPRVSDRARKGDGPWPELSEASAGRGASIALGAAPTMAAISRGIPETPTDE